MAEPDRTPLRVLLFSPVAGRDPLSGDTSYTESLLADPPAGVEYTTYDQALADGSVVELGRKPWKDRQPGSLATFGARAVELLLRRLGLMFREPVWHVRIEASVFDVVHQHLFSVRQVGARVPVVASAGYPLGEHYVSRDGWSRRRTVVAERLERTFARVLDVEVPWLGRSRHRAVFAVYGEHYRQWMIARHARAEDVRIIGTGLAPSERHGWAPQSQGRTVGFVGRDFEAKGGPVALAAFRLLRAGDPAWQMVVATTADNARRIGDEPGVTVHADPSHAEVVERIQPSIDVLLCPTSADCGVPYAMLEALRGGTCVVTSNLAWLDERLGGPGVRRVPNEPRRVAEAVQSLVDAGLDDAKKAARSLWESEFSSQVVNARLTQAYADAIANVTGRQETRS